MKLIGSLQFLKYSSLPFNIDNAVCLRLLNIFISTRMLKAWKINKVCKTNIPYQKYCCVKHIENKSK